MEDLGSWKYEIESGRRDEAREVMQSRKMKREFVIVPRHLRDNDCA